MGNTLTEYLHTIVNTILFCSAIVALLALLELSVKLNKQEIADTSNKASVMVSTTHGYDQDFVYVTGSSVFTDIIEGTDLCEVVLDGVLINPDYLTRLRDGDNTHINDLKTRIVLDANYLISYRYNTAGELVTVSYTKQ